MSEQQDEPTPDEGQSRSTFGLGLRDYFAARASMGILAAWRDQFNPPVIAARAYVIADAMIAGKEVKAPNVEITGTAEKFENNAKFRSLYDAVNTMMAHLGADGEVDTHHQSVSAVMSALHKIDGGNVLTPNGQS